MSRQGRSDAPAGLHLVIARDIARKPIFVVDADRERFPDDLAVLLQETKAGCFARVLIPNHFHVPVRTGPERGPQHPHEPEPQAGT